MRKSQRRAKRYGTRPARFSTIQASYNLQSSTSRTARDSILNSFRATAITCCTKQQMQFSDTTCQDSHNNTNLWPMPSSPHSPHESTCVVGESYYLPCPILLQTQRIYHSQIFRLQIWLSHTWQHSHGIAESDTTTFHQDCINKLRRCPKKPITTHAHHACTGINRSQSSIVRNTCSPCLHESCSCKATHIKNIKSESQNMCTCLHMEFLTVWPVHRRQILRLIEHQTSTKEECPKQTPPLVGLR